MWPLLQLSQLLEEDILALRFDQFDGVLGIYRWTSG